MSQTALAWAALKNMLRAARHDPLWAFIAILISPFRLGPYVLGIALLFCLVGLFIVFPLGGIAVLAIPDDWIAAQIVANIVIGLIFLIVFGALAFRTLANPMIEHFGDLDSTTHGSARFATGKEIAQLVKADSGLLIGRDIKTGKLLRYDGPSHLLTMAPTRTGKGVGTIIPNLIDLDRSVICIDPKGENARITAKARQQFGPVHILDPFGVTRYSSAAFNPLAGLDPESPDAAEYAASLADALVHDDPGQTGDAHWNEEAKALIGGIILHIASHKATIEWPSLTVLREVLTMAPVVFSGLLGAMQASTAAHGLVARAANRHLGKSDREAAGVLSSAQRHTHFLDSPRMGVVLDRSDFSFADLKARTGTVFLVLPPDRLNSYARWLRLMITSSLIDIASSSGQTSLFFPVSLPTPPVLYLLDEFAALGHLAPVERAMGLMAGYGVQLWPILQDIHQLRATYGEKAGTFLSNTGVFQVFGVNDHDSAKLVSDLTGQETVIFATSSQNLDSDRSGISYSEQHTARPLLTPDEIRTMPTENQLLFLAGKHPIRAKKLRYFTDKEFKGKFEITL